MYTHKHNFVKLRFKNETGDKKKDKNEGAVFMKEIQINPALVKPKKDNQDGLSYFAEYKNKCLSLKNSGDNKKTIQQDMD